MTLEESKIKKLYQEAIKALNSLSIEFSNINSNGFSFSDYPILNKKVNKILAELTASITITIEKGTIEAWALANAKNDKFIDFLSKKTGIPKKVLRTKYDYGARNKEGLESFLKRKSNGLGLSDRVWKTTKVAKDVIESSIDIGISEGKSASSLSRDLRNALINPNKIFRKSSDFSSGRGVYKSSYKNAMRLTRTEVNMAYRTADYDRMQEFDFVKGIEIKLSNNPHHCEICEGLKGIYPKNFKFVGWHPQCRCYTEPILMNASEYNAFELATLKGQPYKPKGVVSKLPANTLKWYKDNKGRISQAKSVPYFIKDNKDYFK